MKSIYKAAIAQLSLAGISGLLLFHGRAATAGVATQIPFTFVTVDVPVPGAGSTSVVGINNHGDMVGSYNFIPGVGALGLPAGFLGKGFVWYQDGTFTTIDGPGPANPQLCQPPAALQSCYYIEARGINDRGDIVGTYTQDVLNEQGGLFQAFYQQAGGQFTSYLFPGHTNTIFQRIKDTGVIYGCFHDEGIDNSSQASMHGIINRLRPDGSMQNIEYKTDGTTMNVGGGPVGAQYAGVWYDLVALRHRAYIFTGGERVDFDMPGSNMTQAWDMNLAGDVVGVWGDDPDPVVIDGIPFHGFLRDRSGNFIAIDYPGSIDTHVFGINELGDIVGAYVDSSYNMHGFIARPGDEQTASVYGARFANTKARVAMMPVIPRG